MSSTIGPIVTKTLANQFRSTFVYGTFNNLDNSSSSIPARAAFQRDVLVGTNLFLGNGAVDASGAFLDSSSNIQFTLNKEIVSIPATSLKYLKNVTSDIQQQILDLSNNINNDGGSSTGNFTEIDFTNRINNISVNLFDKIQYLSNTTSNVQTQINSSNSNISTVQNKTTDILWTAGQFNKTTIGNLCETNTLTFSNTLNNISSTTFGYLSGVTSSIQTQISNANTAIGNVAVKTSEISWAVGLPNKTTIANACSTSVLTFSSSLNNISPTVFGYLSGVSSGIQEQINNATTAITALNTKTIDISWISGTVNRTDIRNACSTHTLTFSNSLNNISTTTFSYLSGLTSNIQQQINALNNTNPAGMVIAFAGAASTLNGYLLCDGSIYNSANYSALFIAIGTIYGDAGNGNFRVPNYKGIFLRGAGQQDVQLNVIAGGGAAIFKNFQAPDLGRAVPDQSAYFSTGNYVDQITTQTRSVVTGSPLLLNNFSSANVISGLSYTTTNNSYNFGNPDVHPAHASVQYFIKY